MYSVSCGEGGIGRHGKRTNVRFRDQVENQKLNPNGTLLDVTDLKTYFKIMDGTVKAVDVVGESGCGKTTTGRTILRLNQVTAGKMVFDGKEVFALSPGDLKRTWADRYPSMILVRHPCAVTSRSGRVIGDYLF